MSHRPGDIVYTQSRRQVLIEGITGAMAVSGFWSRSGMVYAAVPGVTHSETPGLTEGPYWVEGQPQRIDVRPDTLTGLYALGLPLVLYLRVYQLSDAAPYTITPLPNARVDIWSCNAQGLYSGVAAQNTTGSNFLRGYQISNVDGVANFRTVYPGWYSGRTPHIHMRVRTFNSSGATTYNWTSQLFFDDAITDTVYAANAAYVRASSRDTYNVGDDIFMGASENGSPAEEAGDYMLLALADNGDSAVGHFNIVLDLLDSENADPTNGASGTTNGGPPGGTAPGGGAAPGGGGAPRPPWGRMRSSRR